MNFITPKVGQDDQRYSYLCYKRGNFEESQASKSRTTRSEKRKKPTRALSIAFIIGVLGGKQFLLVGGFHKKQDPECNAHAHFPTAPCKTAKTNRSQNDPGINRVAHKLVESGLNQGSVFLRRRKSRKIIIQLQHCKSNYQHANHCQRKPTVFEKGMDLKRPYAYWKTINNEEQELNAYEEKIFTHRDFHEAKITFQEPLEVE